MSGTSVLFQVSELAVTYSRPAPVQALRGVSFRLAPGEVLGVVGESGSGKSSLLLAAAGLLPAGAAVRGSIRWVGEELRGAGERRWRALRGAEIGSVFQDARGALDPTMTVGRQVAEAVAARRRLPRDQAWQSALQLLARVELPDPARWAREYPQRLSGGMCQRAQLAVALAGGPRLLLADEPTSALDGPAALALASLLHRLRSELGLAVLLTGHDLGWMARLADRVVVLYAGVAVEEGPGEDVLRRSAHPYTAALVASLPAGTPRGTPLRSLAGGPAPEGQPPAGCTFAPRCPAAMRGCLRAVPPDLAVPGQPGHGARCWLLHPERAGAGVGHAAR